VELLDYARALRRHWILLAASVLFALTAAALVTARTSPQYAASITLIVSAPKEDGTVSSAYQAALLSQQRVKSYAALMQSRGVAAGVADDLGSGLTAGDLVRRITAHAVPDTVLLRATVKDRSPVMAMRIANTLGTEFSRYVDRLERPGPAARPAVKVVMADEADLPAAPVSPRPLRNLGLGLMIGLVAGVAAAVLREAMDSSVTSAQALREAAGTTTLGVIELDPSAARRPLVMRDDTDSTQAEAFRSLRTGILFAGAGDPPRMIAVSSAVREEGKSVIACNLAISLAQAGRRVILVDADLRQPSVARRLGIAATTGLTSVLADGVSLDDVLRPWGPDSLSVLPSGPVPADPSELLASEAMLRTLAELRKRAEIVILDTTALLSVTDTAIIARECGGTLLVARYGSTRSDQISQAVERLTMVNAGVLGAVLNFAPPAGRGPIGFGVPRLAAHAARRRLATMGEGS
jgi:capsular exopolysaccharide synthesis family protein